MFRRRMAVFGSIAKPLREPRQSNDNAATRRRWLTMAIHSSHLPVYRHIYHGINQTHRTDPRNRLAAASSAGSTISSASSSIATTVPQPEPMNNLLLVEIAALDPSTRTMRGMRESETRRMDTATTSKSWEDTPSTPARPTTAIDSARCPLRMWATTKM